MTNVFSAYRAVLPFGYIMSCEGRKVAVNVVRSRGDVSTARGVHILTDKHMLHGLCEIIIIVLSLQTMTFLDVLSFTYFMHYSRDKFILHFRTNRMSR